MSDVKRLNFTVSQFESVVPYASEHGQYVRFADYAKLEAEAQALREQNTKFQHMLADVVAKHFAENIKRSTAQKSMDVYLSEGIRLLEEEVEALRARVVVVPEDLLQRCREILNWQKTGVLKGDALRNLGHARWPDDPNDLQIAESETAREAYRFIDELARLNGKAVSEGLLRTLIGHAKGEIKHLNNGLCPDEVEGHDTRDPDCTVCQSLLGEGKEVDDVLVRE